jgi:glycosyltransferase involved in cell wall biosynthesis
MNRRLNQQATDWFVGLVEHSSRRRRAGMQRRLGTLLEVLTGSPPSAQGSTRRLFAELQAVLHDADSSAMWLSIAVLSGRFPLAADVQRAVRTSRLDGPIAGLRDARALGAWQEVLSRGGVPDVEVIVGAVVVDVEHTAGTALATGIQRVARETLRRWLKDHDDLVTAGWTRDHTALRRLGPEEQLRALTGAGEWVDHGAAVSPVLVPWRSTYLLPELATERGRTQRLLAMAQFAQCTTGLIGFDCVPLTTAETTADGMGGVFANTLAAVRQMDRVAAISVGAATEYQGWQSMLGGLGVPGPRIREVPLPIEAVPSDDHALARARSRLTVGSMPMALVVGSHEPRKNHLAVLHAAELVWRKGRRFNLVFVGGNAWNSDRFTRRLRELQGGGRPIESITALPEDLLWPAYRVARCVVFPSLNEGYGLPAAEALASGTPVVTSSFGSMAEIAAGGGALLVNPRDDHDIAAALDTVMFDDDVHARLSAEAAARPVRTWEQYATEAWDYLVDGTALAP